MRRQRSAKRLGTRHDLNYFKQWTNWKRARIALSIAIPLIAVSWLGAVYLNGDSHPASAGPLSRGHSFFANDCAACHSQFVKGVKLRGFRQDTSDEACITCHAAPVHHANQVATPSCGTCHVEHKGAARLAEVAVQNCVTCHGDLKTSDSKHTFVTRITGFNSDHPEFTALRTKQSDPGTIAFNHAVHLKGVTGPDGKRVVPDCTDCHRTAADQGAPWRFATASFTPQASSPDRAYMLPPTYEGTCAGCHDLRFDPNIQEGAPHDKPEVVYAFLQKTYSGAPKYSVVKRPARLIPSSAHSEATTPTQHLAVAARLLWAKTCNECHNVEFSPGNPVPTIADAQITRVWLPHSTFDHAPHRSFTCTSCHQGASSSQQTSDVLVPGIAVCQTCHSGDPQQAGRSENRCFECHEYHDWKNQPAFRGNYTPAMRRTRTE